MVSTTTTTTNNNNNNHHHFTRSDFVTSSCITMTTITITNSAYQKKYSHIHQYYDLPLLTLTTLLRTPATSSLPPHIHTYSLTYYLLTCFGSTGWRLPGLPDPANQPNSNLGPVRTPLVWESEPTVFLKIERQA